MTASQGLTEHATQYVQVLFSQDTSVAGYDREFYALLNRNKLCL